MNKEKLKKAFLITIPVMTGYILLGMGFGILLDSKGYGIGYSVLMSVFIYAGSMQYLAVDLLAGGASLITTALTTLMVNARHLFYGISMIEKYKNIKYKNYLIFALTDETYSLVCQDTKHSDDYYFLVSILNQSYWIIGCVLGSLVGAMIEFNTAGIDFVLTALFLTIFTEQWLSTKKHSSALIGVLCSLVCLVVFGANNFLIPSMISILFLISAMKRKDEKDV